MSEQPEDKRYPYFGIPPARQPLPAEEVPALKGKRVVLSTPDGFVYDMRAVSDIHPDKHSRPSIAIMTEEAYYEWMLTGRVPEIRDFPAHLVWVE
ncbi:hypothetical protein EKO23_01815 [Nocardioides guangzhouensis]|uniref:Uncharacterized protein n=1 Tax=Nocardioides guangzhouensis TaxID=2497878 RepID=A0A4Q4ZM12_9ACTN|nr:hypothetical protein [Nocardioides guangzhouensis]RYP88651.1 hypothetical protein EKO23_01815 [Nocardioides guangzhouensis]